MGNMGKRYVDLPMSYTQGVPPGTYSEVQVEPEGETYENTVGQGPPWSQGYHPESQGHHPGPAVIQLSDDEAR